MYRDDIEIKEVGLMSKAHHSHARTMLVGSRQSVGDGTSPYDQKLSVAGSIVGALAATSCCILPLVLFSLGVSGAWIGNLTRLAPYQPYILAFTAACLGYGYWRVYRYRQTACADAQSCARPLPNRIVISGLIIATVLVAAALSFDFIAPLLLSGA